MKEHETSIVFKNPVVKNSSKIYFLFLALVGMLARYITPPNSFDFPAAEVAGLFESNI